MAVLVKMTPDGRVTIPAKTRRSLGVEGETQLEVDVRDDAIVLRPAVVLPREDAWAYTTTHRRLLARAHADVRDGRVRRLTERQLARMRAR